MASMQPLLKSWYPARAGCSGRWLPATGATAWFVATLFRPAPPFDQRMAALV